MSKTYHNIQTDSSMVSEPMATYRGSSYLAHTANSVRERLLANTVSVDDFFDELISLVRSDYATI